VDWAKNLKSRKHSAKKISQLRIDQSSLCAAFWHQVRANPKIPRHVFEDIDDFIKDLGGMSMDAAGELSEGDGSGRYKVMVGGVEYMFHKTRLAPPSAMMAENYAR
jgi:hypothetical protein